MKKCVKPMIPKLSHRFDAYNKQTYRKDGRPFSFKDDRLVGCPLKCIGYRKDGKYKVVLAMSVFGLEVRLSCRSWYFEPTTGEKETIEMRKDG